MAEQGRISAVMFLRQSAGKIADYGQALRRRIPFVGFIQLV
jgi:hypothetical protein